MVDCFYSLCGNYRDYCSPFALHGSGRTDFLYAEAVRNHGIGYDCPDVVGTSAAFSHRTGFGVTDRDSFDGFDRGRRYLYFADDRRWNTHFAGFFRFIVPFTSRIYSPDHCCDSVSDCFYSVPGVPPFDFCRKFVCLVPFVFCFVIGFGNDFGQ